MENKTIFYGTREEWLKSEQYIVADIYSDDFAIDFRTHTFLTAIENGEKVEEPIFETEGPF